MADDGGGRVMVVDGGTKSARFGSGGMEARDGEGSSVIQEDARKTSAEDLEAASMVFLDARIASLPEDLETEPGSQEEFVAAILNLTNDNCRKIVLDKPLVVRVLIRALKDAYAATELVDRQSLVYQLLNMFDKLSNIYMVTEEIYQSEGVQTLLLKVIKNEGSDNRAREFAVSILHSVCGHDDVRLHELQQKDSEMCISQLKRKGNRRARRMAARIVHLWKKF